MAGPEFGPVTQEEATELVENLREEDAKEWQALAGEISADGVLAMAASSDIAKSVRWGGDLVGVYGIAGASLLSSDATIWFLGTHAMKRRDVRREFIRRAPFELARLSDGYATGRNYVSASNRDAIRWLRFIGAAFGASIVVDGVEFRPFTVRF